ncbi:hypothetical protein GCM10028806_39220 [Spirosoma terrae]|uniref:Gliding motility-associated C-terminal domain-containing protein n=1 Tax=Spirosoma terrae TaxID=1968276 RepID=A0A6L9LBH7_9BACT|nr:gliding motility-associated C-terminal domain-containing protein [Spirosoma terrae]NDU97856.1 gliding motility-associated C-terminal domain-containing protein [Spirosoma terrae]
MRLFILLLLLLAGVPVGAIASHQVGGQLEMQAIGDTPGHYRITVTNYLEAGTPGVTSQSRRVFLGIFRKRDNALMMTFVVFESAARQPVIFSNEYCASQRNLRFLVLTYQAEIQLNPSEYTDTQGYYLSYQTGTRNTGISNVVNPDRAGFTFYLEFPALWQNGRNVKNSSPQFPAINGEYICLNEPFAFSFGGSDPDGDELRYSLVTPLNGRSAPEGPNIVSAAPYPGLRWRPGYSATNAIPGSPPLSINARTGQLAVTANRAGLFLFAVRVEEYRNNRKIGEVRREFQLLVIDCPAETVPLPELRVNNQPATNQAKTLCRGDSALLQTPNDSNLHYQWRRNGINLPNATTPSLVVRDTGAYDVIVTSQKECLKPGQSQTITIRRDTASGQVKAIGTLCAIDGSVLLLASTQSSVRYEWYRNGRLLTPTTDSIRVDQEGTYWAQLTHTDGRCSFQTDTFTLARLPASPASIRSVSGRTKLCPNDSLLLESSRGSQYSWQRDGQPIPNANKPQYQASVAGRYVVKIVGSDGCAQLSNEFVVEQIPPITVLFDSIPPSCSSTALPVTLRGSPAGGAFAGVGVTGNTFDPLRAGIGLHSLSYTVKPTPECPGIVATQTAVVGRAPSIALPDSIVTHSGSTFPIVPTVSDDALRFSWSPSTYLDNPTNATVTVVTIQDDITYTLRAFSESGCYADGSVHIRVIDQIWVPDAFTPNGDGLNDVLELPGVRAFPEAVITIFNRWGGVVFKSEKGYPKPFDGTLNGNELPTGIYSYQLQTTNSQPPTEGSIMLLRN